MVVRLSLLSASIAERKEGLSVVHINNNYNNKINIDNNNFCNNNNIYIHIKNYYNNNNKIIGNILFFKLGESIARI